MHSLIMLIQTFVGCSSGGGGPAGQGDDSGPSEQLCTRSEVSELGARIHEDYGTLVYVSWEQGARAGVHVEYTFEDDQWRSTPVVDAGVGGQEQLLLGIPYDTEVTFRVANDCGDAGLFYSSESTISTGARPPDLPVATLIAGEDTRWDADVDYVFTGLQGRWSVLLDREARVVWARESARTTYTMYPRLSHGGDSLLIDEGTFWTRFDDGVASQVVRTNIDGSTVTTYDTPGLFIGFTDLPDGTIAWPATGDSSAAINDDTLELLTPSGEQVRAWSCRDFMSSVPGGATRGDYCAANTLSWSESRGTFLWTSFSPEAIFEIDPATGETLRYFGQLSGAWAFEPGSREFWLPHGSYYTESGTLLMSSDLTRSGEETIVIEYELDEASQTLVETWSFGEGEGLYGQERGEAHRLPGGNTLHNIGGVECRLREITPDGEVVWDVGWDAVDLGGSSPVTDIYALAP